MRLAPCQRRQLDGADVLGLEFALARALRVSPEAVLGLAPEIPLAGICTVPWIEMPEELVRCWRLSVRPVLQDVSDPALRQRCGACLTLINGSVGHATP